MRVLLVGADVEVLGSALGRAGYNVVTALDGDGALQRWEADHPDMVLLDVGLACVDGLEVSRRIRERAGTPIILLSERSAEADILAGFEAGADAVVSKPFSTRQLLARMQSVLRRCEPNAAWVGPDESRPQ